MPLPSDRRPGGEDPANFDLPPPLDCETAALLRGFLMPLIEDARSWEEMRGALAERGYDIAFRKGHMVIVATETGRALCTGQSLGTPLRDLAARLGRPCVRVHPGGCSGDLER